MVGPNPVERGEKEREKKKEKKREENRRGVRSSNFSLDLSEIGPSIRVGARGKVGPHIESYVCRGFSPTRFNSCLRAIQMDGVFGAGMVAQLSLEILGLNIGIFWTVSDSRRLDFWESQD